jgi:CHAT domain-containing protein/Tfp pilus assembly protein PilF
LDNGIVVEWLTKSGEAQKAGMQAGDILQSWTGATSKGEIDSPFALPYLGFEQAPRGAVRIEGLRRGEKRTWVLRTTPWGIATRPNVTDPILAVYLQAEELAHSGNLTEAVKGWRTAATKAQDSGVPSLSAWFLSHAGEALFRAKQMKASDELYRDAIQRAAESGPIVRGDLFRQWAGQLEAREDLVRAEKYYQQELLEWQRLDAELLVAKSLNALGGLFLEKGDYKSAESSLLQSVSISEKLAPAATQRVVSYGNLAVLYQDRGDLGTADKYYRLALAIERQYFPGTSNLAVTLTDFGILARWRGNLAAAEGYHREALAIAEKLKLPLNIADILDNISDCRLDQGDLANADAYQKRALAIREQDGTSLPVASSLASLGKITRLKGNLDVAADYYRRALELADKLDPPPPQRASFFAGLGDVNRDRGSFREAEQQYRQALALMDQLAPRSLDHAETSASLGATLRRQGHLEEAAESYRQALADLEYQTASVGAVEENQARHRARHADYYREYVDLLVEEGQTELAFQTLESSHARTLFEMLAQTQINVRQGVEATLLARERDLRQSLNAKSQYRLRLLSEKHTDGQIDGLDREIASLHESHNQIEADIRASSPSYAALTQPQSLGAKDIQKLLGPQTVLLEYSLGEQRSYVWVVSESSLDVRELPKRATIERLARQLYNALTVRTHRVSTDPKIEVANWAKGDALSQRLAASLSRMVLAPAANLIEGKRLLIVSDGALQYVPFAALPAPGNPTTPLLVKHEIVNLPSASVLAEIRRAIVNRPRPLREVAVLADPVFDPKDDRVIGLRNGSTPTPALARSRELVSRSATDVGFVRRGGFYLQRLTYTRHEAEAILAVTPRGQTLEALDFQANRSMAISPELARYRIIHFATHGFLDSKHPELSGLVLSLVDRKGRPQDGFLGLEDVYNLKLPVDLVVLSGCRTGLGEEVSGEGLMGLTRGFMFAGASRVVASLWSVDDFTTAELMANFYRAMERDKMPPAAALRKAQIAIWKHTGWHPPYYWAAFQLQGEWK